MSLDDFAKEQDAGLKYKKYNYTELDEKLENIADSLKDRFPKDFRLDFIEASPALEKHGGKAYYRIDNSRKHYYIRIQKRMIESDHKRLKFLVLHELVHIYLYNLGYNDISDGDPLFHWVLGAVGASVNHISVGGDKWNDICQPFIDSR